MFYYEDFFDYGEKKPAIKDLMTNFLHQHIILGPI